ncbi:small ribosomal subunit biogenesis GTPase RsgA [Aliikangiella marina]|uniref:Small ribosomal subunit biogenesis GTPase RsgA n=1 Tax=Aliikangiella marina TaxID=1712262 RepID=A0A545T732_9GAMM|nr:small ribosomal subunit biogenesis GTPase RsgA [Aliikangiella marina]TQV73033.1 small ribosomal subunit biogenesis GTPase RsgA [Aliikangiella marina]
MAKRDKLTQRQKRQVAKTQRKRLNKQSQAEELGDLSAPMEGLLVSRYGEQADVLALKDHQKFRCYLRQNLGAPVPGDKVRFRLDPNQQGVVETIHERHSVLQRPSPHQGLKPVVANIDKVFVVIAPLPDFSALLLDRYLVAIRDAEIPVHIIANKWDLSEEFNNQQIEAQLQTYQQLGYPVTFVSTKNGKGIDELATIAKDISSVLVGQSGVGKSSIINRLFPSQHSKVDLVSSNSRLGQHTTTASQLFLFDSDELQHEGFIIDSPGIREFGLWHMDSHTVANGFVEFDPHIGGCKFRDCKHVNEPGCAIINAVKTGEISESRWLSYCKIIANEETNN